MNRMERLNKRVEYLEQMVAILADWPTDKVKEVQKAVDTDMNRYIDNIKMSDPPPVVQKTGNPNCFDNSREQMKAAFPSPHPRIKNLEHRETLNEHLGRIEQLEKSVKRLWERIEGDFKRSATYLHSPHPKCNTTPGDDPHENTRELRRFSLWTESKYGPGGSWCEGVGVRFPNGYCILGTEGHLKIYSSEAQMAEEHCGQGATVHVQYLDSPR